MGEYISREAVVLYLKRYSEKEWNPSSLYGMMTSSVLHKAERAILELPSADVQPVDRWISVDDRLPNIGERVFVYIPRPDNHYNTEIAYISEGNDDYPYWVLGDKSQFYSTRFHYISHWMSLPEPPKGSDTEEHTEVNSPDGNCLDCEFQYLEDSDYWCSVCPGNPEDI